MRGRLRRLGERVRRVGEACHRRGRSRIAGLWRDPYGTPLIALPDAGAEDERGDRGDETARGEAADAGAGAGEPGPDAEPVAGE